MLQMKTSYEAKKKRKLFKNLTWLYISACRRPDAATCHGAGLTRSNVINLATCHIHTSNCTLNKRSQHVSRTHV